MSNMSSSDCGKSSGTATGEVPLNSQVTINNSPDLSSCIVGQNGAYVQKITYQSHTGPARNAELNVFGQGPGGSGQLTLKVVTPNGTHTVSLSGDTPGCHTDRFSDGAAVTSINWYSE
jgi:hypothetical protein